MWQIETRKGTGDNLTFCTVDNSPKCLEIAKRVCGELPVKYTLADSTVALESWTDPIDFLYLDSLDCDPDPRADNSEPQHHNLRELLPCP